MERDMGSERATQCKAAREHRLNVRRAAKRRTLEERTARREALALTDATTRRELDSAARAAQRATQSEAEARAIRELNSAARAAQRATQSEEEARAIRELDSAARAAQRTTRREEEAARSSSLTERLQVARGKERALLLFLAGDVAHASLEMRRAVREAGQLASGEDLHNLAAVLMSQDMSSDEVVECEALLRRAEERAANPLARARSLVNLGWLLARSAGAQELERTFRRAAEVGDPLGLLNLGLYLCRGDFMDEAATCFVRAAEKKAPFAWQYCALLTEVVEGAGLDVDATYLRYPEVRYRKYGPDVPVDVAWLGQVNAPTVSQLARFEHDPYQSVLMLYDFTGRDNSSDCVIPLRKCPLLR